MNIWIEYIWQNPENMAVDQMVKCELGDGIVQER